MSIASTSSTTNSIFTQATTPLTATGSTATASSLWTAAAAGSAVNTAQMTGPAPGTQVHHHGHHHHAGSSTSQTTQTGTQSASTTDPSGAATPLNILT